MPEDIAQRAHQNYLYQRQKDPNVKVAIWKTLTRLSQGQKLTLINTITRQMFDSELDTIKEEIFTAVEQLHEEQAEAAQCGAWTPEDYLESVSFSNNKLEVLIQPTMGIFILAGQNKHDHSFEDDYTHFSVNPKDKDAGCTSFDEGVITLFGRFLKTLFHEFY
ncbi:hypothetical protein EDD18DRAFT_1112475 [Armillaria luteobubalina]|uniref:Uncharacterized protein n=1 Tax=Armillaria luteobubalina TaxID=153913 RepID=A0AA39PFW1_9AGAR|nr:hypothetical protein EDD18DRAFT_1112475 [Armillaria luteobubalina]